MYHAVQTCVGAYTGLFSAMAIYNLKQREEQTERAAQYSTTAANQLHKTRTTQTSGAVAVRWPLCPPLISVSHVLT